MHSCMRFPFKSSTETRCPPDIQLQPGSDGLIEMQERHRQCQYYFIDEVGMIGAKTLGVIDSRLRQSHSDESMLGSKSVILFGHHAQLPPVKDDPIYPPRTEKDPKGMTAHQSNGRLAY